MKGNSLLAKFFTGDVKKKLQNVRTTSGFTIEDVVRSGTENPDSSIGVYAPDEESYKVFGALFNPVIEEYHGHTEDDFHKNNFNADELDISNPDEEGAFIVSTRVRVGRNLKDFPFNPGISRKERLEVERRVVEALESLEGDLSGKYYPLSGMKEEVREQLVEDHFLFKQGDRFLESAGVNHDWPEGRGIFHSDDKKFLVWVNEEDQLRIISMEQGGDIYSVFNRLARAVSALEKKLEFACSEKLGYLSSCPTNLGTAMRASVHMSLPKLSQRDGFKEMCEEMGLSCSRNSWRALRERGWSI